jgi:hypothetical protein
MTACIILYNMIIEDERDLSRIESPYESSTVETRDFVSPSRSSDVMSFVKKHETFLLGGLSALGVAASAPLLALRLFFDIPYSLSVAHFGSCLRMIHAWNKQNVSFCNCWNIAFAFTI